MLLKKIIISCALLGSFSVFAVSPFGSHAVSGVVVRLLKTGVAFCRQELHEYEPASAAPSGLDFDMPSCKKCRTDIINGKCGYRMIKETDATVREMAEAGLAPEQITLIIDSRFPAFHGR